LPLVETDGSSALESFVSPYTGLVRTTVEFLRAPHEPTPSSVGCALAEGDDLAGAPLPSYTAGMHWRPGAARAAAIGEAVERYSAAIVPEEDLILATATELGPAAAAPSGFALFDDWQYAQDGFRFARFRDDTRIRWIRGFALPGGGPALLPAQLVYMRPPRADEPVLAISTSNGLACATSFEAAVLGGLLEVIERDCFMLAWYNRLSLPRLDWSGDAVLAGLDAEHFAGTGLGYAALDASAFFEIPVLVGIVRSDRFFGVGAGCAPTMREAWRKALTEAFSVHRWLQDKLIDEPERRPRDRADLRDFDDHVLYYADPEHATRADFLDASTAITTVATCPEIKGTDDTARTAEICTKLAARGVSAYAVDVTAPDVRSAGLHVARVICPELCSLDVLGWAPHLGGRRMLHAAHEAGLLAEPLTPEQLNPDPHPFP
jgi:ribosomal protein S12 methylthiotransferase accessory factor